MKATDVDLTMTVDQIMCRWPATIPLFIRSGTHCVGCVMGTFHTVRDACDAHRLDEKSFLRELLAAVGGH